MDLEDDTHMNTQPETTTVQEVINVPIMLSPEMYSQLADLVLHRIENNNTFDNIINAKIDSWMDRNLDLIDYRYDNIKEDLLDSVRYDLKNSLRAEVEIYID